MERFQWLYSGALALWAVSAPFTAYAGSAYAGTSAASNGTAASSPAPTKAAPVKILKAKPLGAIPAPSEILPDRDNTQVTPGLPALDGFATLTETGDPEIKAGSVSQGASKESRKPILGDALISQNTLRIFLDRPASISVFNARGQLVFHQDSQRQMETLPLQGMQTGFLYLTLRSGSNELTKKLLYTGK